MRGTVAMALGIVAIAWPGITVGGFVLVFAIYAFAEALIEGATAARRNSPGPVVGHLVLAVLDVAAAVIAVVWPGVTVFALILWVGTWAVVTGVTEVVTAFRAGETPGERAMWGIAGAISVVFGVVLFAHPRVGALSLALVFGVFALAFGVSHIALGLDVRRTGLLGRVR